MEIYTMNYVLAVADLGNFSLAAQACHVGQPALSPADCQTGKRVGHHLVLPQFTGRDSDRGG